MLIYHEYSNNQSKSLCKSLCKFEEGYSKFGHKTKVERPVTIITLLRSQLCLKIKVDISNYFTVTKCMFLDNRPVENMYCNRICLPKVFF